jgi:hypothetical protein
MQKTELLGVEGMAWKGIKHVFGKIFSRVVVSLVAVNPVPDYWVA